MIIKVIDILDNKQKKNKVRNLLQELKTGADGYTDVLKIEGNIWGRTLEHRKEKG